MEEIQSDSAQPDIPLEKAASVEGLESSEKQKKKEVQKRSSSTSDIPVSQDNANKEEELFHPEPHRDILSELLVNASTIGEPPSIEPAPPYSILSELLAHIPIGSSDYLTKADSVVHSILADILEHVPAAEKKSGESIAHSVLSDLLSHLSSEVAAHKVSLDCEYLKEHLGRPLTLGLSEVVIKRPVDPIHYLAHWLFKWRWNQKKKQTREEEINALTVERQKAIAELKERERIEAEQRAIIELKKQASEAAILTLETALSQAFELISEQGEGDMGEGTEEEGPEAPQQ